MLEQGDSKSNENNQLLIILGNQLFPISEIKKPNTIKKKIKK